MDEEKKRGILKLILTDRILERYFFRDLKDPSWIPLLEAAAILNTKNAPPVEIKSDGSTVGVEWPILPYLCRVVESYGESPSVKNYFPQIIEFWKKAASEHKNNWRTLFWLAKIISAFPPEYIGVEMVELLKPWLDVPGSSLMISSELCCDLFPKLVAKDPSSSDLIKAELLFSIITQTARRSEEGTLAFTSRHIFLLDHHWVNDGLHKAAIGVGTYFTDDAILRIVDRLSAILYDSIFKKTRSEEQFGLILSLEYNQDNDDHYLLLTVRKNEVGKIGSHKFPLKLSRIEFANSARCFIHTLEAQNEEALECIRGALIRLHAGLFDEDCYPALGDGFIIRDDDPQNIIIRFLQELLVQRAKVNQHSILQLANKLYDRDLLIFPKIALFLTSKYIDTLRPSFFQALVGENQDVLLEGLYFGAELKGVLERLIPISEDERTLLHRKIELGSILWSAEFPENPKYKSYWKQERYGALKQDSFFYGLYSSIKEERGGADAELRPAVGPIEMRRGWGESPFNIGKILELDSEELVRELNQFTPTNSFDGPTIGGLAEVLEAAVRQQPKHFLRNLKHFGDLGYLWVSRIISGLEEVLVTGIDNSWQYLVPFLEDYTSREKFWANELPTSSEYYALEADNGWVLGAFCSILQKSMSKDGVGLTNFELLSLKALLHRWMLSVQWPESNSYSDSITEAINVPAGKVSEALLFLLLCIARRADENEVEKSKRKIRWADQDRVLFDKIIDEEREVFFSIIGMFLTNLHYLDYDWVVQKIPIILERKPWMKFLIGFLHYGAFNKDLYRLLYQGFLKFEQHESVDKIAARNLIHYATIAYLRGIEKLSGDGLFAKILNCDTGGGLLEVISKIGNLPDKSPESATGDPVAIWEFSPLALQLWEFVIDNPNIIRRYDDKHQRLICRELLEIIAFIPKIENETEQLVIRTIKMGIPENDWYPFFLERLLELGKRSDNEVARVGRIFLELLDYVTPSFRKETIIELVDIIFQAPSSKNLAVSICEKYARRGFDFLKPTYDSNRAN